MLINRESHEKDDGSEEVGERSGNTRSRQKEKKDETQESKSVEDLASTLRKTREEDLKKGKAVKRQIAIWDTLLDTRIRLQKSVVSANRLPGPSEIKLYHDSEECSQAMSKFLQEALLLTDELEELQESLLKINNIITPSPRKRPRLDLEASLDVYSEGLKQATEDVSSLEQVYHPYLLQTLGKWSSKIQAVAPSALLPSKRGTFLQGTNVKSVIQLVDENLAEHDKLLSRTQIVRVKKPRIGAQLQPDGQPDDTDDKHDIEIFDDTDFYQKLLRDIIDSKGDGNRNEDWLMLQKQKKAKKKVDTKASKGRKLRYDVHEKIQNFMVPVPLTGTGAWHEEQVDELFASLLGKGFENIALNSEEPKVQESIELTGFRVFG